jgi:hypothetical protein
MNRAHARDERQTPEIVWFLALLRVVVVISRQAAEACLNPSREYNEFVEHPRFGRGPRFTSIRLGPVPPGYRLTNYYISSDIVWGTAIAADLERQSYAAVPVLYYFDVERVCLDCGRPFIFFAEEQRHWHETLGFALDADCVRCTDCRRKQHVLKRRWKRYDELSHVENRSSEEHLEMAEHCLALMEEGLSHQRQATRVRMLLNRIPKERSEAIEQRYNEIRRRLREYETAISS